MAPPRAEALLRVWELGRHRHPVDRAVLLRGLAEPDTDHEALADEPLGRRNVALLRLRQAAFGNRLAAYLDCPRCAARLECELDAETLLASPIGEAAPVEVEGLAFRPPTSRDLAAIVDEPDPPRAALRLLRRCLTGADPGMSDAGLEPLLDRVEGALQRADPLADVTLDFRCEACGHAWTSSFDIPRFVWEEVEAYAARLLDEIHVLARAYGWTEPEILALSDSRRAAYLERATA